MVVTSLENVLIFPSCRPVPSRRLRGKEFRLRKRLHFGSSYAENYCCYSRERKYRHKDNSCSIALMVTWKTIFVLCRSDRMRFCWRSSQRCVHLGMLSLVNVQICITDKLSRQALECLSVYLSTVCLLVVPSPLFTCLLLCKGGEVPRFPILIPKLSPILLRHLTATIEI